MTDFEVLVEELHDIRLVLDQHLERQNDLISALVAVSQRSAVALEDHNVRPRA